MLCTVLLYNMLVVKWVGRWVKHISKGGKLSRKDRRGGSRDVGVATEARDTQQNFTHSTLPVVCHI